MWVYKMLGQLYDLSLWLHPWPWPWSFRVRVWNSFISGMGADLQWPKRMWVIHSWPWYWLVWPWWGRRMYRVMTGVTSDVGMPSTYLVWLDLQIIIFFGFEMISITIKSIVCFCQQHSRGKMGTQNRLLINVNFIYINCTFSLFFGI